MMIWVYAVAFAALFALIGYSTGALRAAVWLIGTFIALAVAGPLGRVFAPIGPKMIPNDPIWQQLIGPLLAFAAVWLLVLAASYAVQRPLAHHYKYKEDQATLDNFEALNHSGGVFFGLLVGMVVFFALGKLAYPAGYLTAQTTNESTETGVVKLSASLRKDMEQSGWDRTFAALDRTPQRFYEISDVLGLLHENPALQQRLREYPPFLSLADRPEFGEMTGDKEYMDLFTQKAGFGPVVRHARTQAVLGNAEVTEALLKTDLADLKQYLETGHSPLADDEKVLGRWKVDINAVLLQVRRQRQGVTPTEFAALRAMLTTVLTPVQLTVYPEGKFAVKSSAPAAPATPANAEGEGTTAAPAAAATAEAAPRIDPRLASRYGLRNGAYGGGATAPAARPAPAAATKAPAIPKIDFSGDGSWTKADGKYVFKSGSGEEMEASINEQGKIIIALPKQKISLYFVRVG